MRSQAVVPVEARSKARPLFSARVAGTQIDPFVLDGPPQAFDEDVVVTAPPAIHADLDAMCLEHAGEFGAGELAALVGVEDLGGSVAGDGFLERRRAEVGVVSVKLCKYAAWLKVDAVCAVGAA